MQHSKEIVTAVGTLAIAVGIGFFMQSSEAAKERYGKQARPTMIESPDVIQNGASGADVLLQVQEIELTSATEIAVSVPVPESVTDVYRASAPADLPRQPEDVPSADICEISAQAVAVEAAMVSLNLEAPCAPNERLIVHHNGMMFTQTTDAAGSLTVTVPALAEQAVFIMAFSDGDGAVAQTTVTDISQYDRIAIQWRGQAGFELHAREFGADYGQPGHLWSGSTQNKDGLAKGENGLITRLGDSLTAEPLIAEVYTFPSVKSARFGAVDMSVEAEVTASNCGREIEAKSLEIMGGGQIKTRNLTLSVPECGAVGSFLVLNNLVSDLKVAGN